jgi:hypothetical protein
MSRAFTAPKHFAVVKRLNTDGNGFSGRRAQAFSGTPSCYVPHQVREARAAPVEIELVNRFRDDTLNGWIK